MLILLLTVMARTVIKKYVSHGFDFFFQSLTISFSIEKNQQITRICMMHMIFFLPKRTKCIIISTFVIQ